MTIQDANNAADTRRHGWVGIWHVQHCDKDGNVLHEETTRNMLHDDGERALLSAYFATAYSTYGAPPANLYLGLDNRSTLAEADIYSTLTGEPSTNGYARQALSTAGTGVGGQDWVVSQPGSAYQVQSKQVTFSASGGPWGPVTKAFLMTTVSGTGKLLASLALSQSRTLSDGETLKVDITIALSE